MPYPYSHSLPERLSLETFLNLFRLFQIKINPTHPSYYVVRTQPHNECLSTVESVALALSKMEQRPELNHVLVKPLVAMCAFQVSEETNTQSSSRRKDDFPYRNLWDMRISRINPHCLPRLNTELRSMIRRRNKSSAAHSRRKFQRR